MSKLSIHIIDLVASRHNICRLVLLIPLVCLLCTKVSAQQDALLSQYMHNRLIINPAYAGSSNMLRTSIGYRQQHVGITGAPSTQLLTIHAPIIKQSMGLGIKAIHETIGATSQNSVVAVYAYHLSLSKGKLSFGLEGGIFNQSIDFTNLVKTVPDDNALPKGKVSVLVPDASFGMYYHSEKFYIGAALYHLLQNKLNFSGYIETDRAVIGKLSSHAYFTAGYAFKTGENLSIEPSVLLRYAGGAPLDLDVNLNATIKQTVTIGASYRIGNALVFLVQYSLKKKFRLGYSYGYTTSKLSAYNSGSHEITLGYNIALKTKGDRKKTDEEPIEEIAAIADDKGTEPVAEEQKTNQQERETESEATKDDVIKDSMPEEELTENTAEQPGEDVEEKSMDSKGIIFKVQIQSTKEPIYISPANFKGLENVEENKAGDSYHYLTGNTKYYDYANAVLLTQVRSHGYADAHIVAFKDGKQISIDEALYLPGAAKMPSSVQSEGSSKLKGKVTLGGVAVQGVSIKLLDVTDLVEEVITSEKGEYSFNVLSGGDYSLYVTKKGYFDRFIPLNKDEVSELITIDIVVSKK